MKKLTCVCSMGLFLGITRLIYAGDVLGGTGNTATGTYAVVAGGYHNAGDGRESAIGGGEYNEANGQESAICGGEYNDALGLLSFIGGGGANYVTGTSAGVGGGEENRAGGYLSFVAGGFQNYANGDDSFVGGGDGNDASGDYACIPGGSDNEASGDYSFAGGRRAKCTHQGTFVWGDSTAADVSSTGDNRFIVRAAGGVWFYSNQLLTSGVKLVGGSGSWSSLSDRNAKEHIETVNGRDVLDALSKIPVATWNYKTQDDKIRHMGPMAQDFHAAFGVGEDEKTISNVDADGVALAAIQGLNEKLNQKDAEILELQTRLADLEKIVLSK